jgi:hypothetical protein
MGSRFSDTVGSCSLNFKELKHRDKGRTGSAWKQGGGKLGEGGVQEGEMTQTVYPPGLSGLLGQ